MPTLIIETKINAAPEVCFDSVRRASAETIEQTITGEFGEGQTVTFQNSFFGFKQNLTVKVTEFKRPRIFIDEMTAGNLKAFRHIHEFILQNGNRTLLKDIFEWTSPLGIFGKIFDNLFLEKRLRKSVTRRNSRLKEITGKIEYVVPFCVCPQKTRQIIIRKNLSD